MENVVYLTCADERAAPWDVTPEETGLRLTRSDGEEAWFHYFWLRENCHCPKCTHPEAWERIVDLLKIPHDIKPESIKSSEDGLRLTWPTHDAPCDGTFYSWSWLDEHRTENKARLARKKKRTSWRAGAFTIDDVSVDFDDILNSDAGLQAFLEYIDDVGVAFSRNTPNTHEAVIALASHIAHIEESHFGRDYEVVSKPNPENLAYTSHALYPHNDLPSRKYLPGVQFLHCRQNDATGGESILVDSIAVASRLRDENKEFFEFLSTKKVTFSSIDESWHIVNRSTVIEVDEDGEIVGTRIHPALIGPVDVEPDDMDLFYRAHRAVIELCTSPDMQLSFRLQDGDCQVFDNYRILHARAAFDPNSGGRHLHGLYVTRDDLQSRLEVLRRGGASFRRT